VNVCWTTAVLATSLPVQDQTLYVFAGAALFIATTLGFLAGYLTASRPKPSAAEQVVSGVKTLVDRLTTSLDVSLEACDQLDQVTQAVLVMPQAATLESKRTGLSDKLGRFLDRQTLFLKSTQEASAAKPSPLPEWATQPADGVTGLPGKTAFETNLKQMLGATSFSTSGVILARVDRFANLVERYGAVGADAIARRFSQVLCRHIRESDCLCRISADTWGLLTPGLEPEELRQMAADLRDAVKTQHFRLETLNTEALVTAGFGLTAAYSGEASELAYDRALAALNRAARAGRNRIETASATPRLAVG
jgi:diguanylate cyclase (GGDEF)-like protein